MSTSRSTTGVGCTLALYVDVMRCLSGRGAGGELAENCEICPDYI